MAFQYDRETEYKAELLNLRLQSFNRQLADKINNGYSAEDVLSELSKPIKDLRVSIIDSSGNVIFDNTLDRYDVDNHLNRPEVSLAIQKGEGYIVRRHSESTNDNFFYSATKIGNNIYRSAAPYTVSLSNLLSADRNFFWFMCCVTIVMCMLAWVVTRRIGRTVTRLNYFALRAERGEQIYDDEAFPHDELGDISHHIVTLYAQRERQHNEALHQEQEKIRIKKQLTNNINHELKTPLAAMQVCIETLLTHPELSREKKMHFLNKCWDNSNRLKSLLTDISTLTRLDDGKEAISTESLSLNNVITEAIDDFCSPDSIPINLDLQENITINGNESLLSAIFHNLIQNANNYSQASAITIRMNSSDENINIVFSDNGVGIPSQHLPHIFERFYRLDKGRSRAKGGTGLGLSIVKNAVSFHNGTISANNNPEGGLRFIISLKK